MTRVGSLVVVLAMLGWTIAPADAAQTAPGRQPNIVYILADDLGYGDVSCFNDQSKIHTPNIDALARAGMRFTDAHSNSAVCTPTRYGILTGRYCWRTTLKSGVLNGYSKPLIEPHRITVASFLHERGYATACVGKWHLGLGWQLKDETSANASPQTVDFSRPVTVGPRTFGFDYSFIIPASLDMPPYVYLEDGQVAELPTRTIPDSPRPAYWRGGLAAPHFQHQTCLLELTRHAVAWLDHRQQDGRPFFLYLALSSPHTPHMPRPQFQGTSGAGNYGDFVIETDWTVGQIADALSRNHLDDNTLLIMTSDNGAHSEPLHLEQLYGHRANYIFRGQKSDAWDGGHHIPFVARWPGHVPANTVCDQTICLTDLFATCAAILQRDLPNDAAEDSFSILPLLLGHIDRPARPAVVLHSNDGKFALKQGPWKLILCRGSGGWTLPENKVPADAPPAQLYNMQDDPSETTNLYAQRPQIVAELQATLDRYRQEGRSAPGR